MTVSTTRASGTWSGIQAKGTTVELAASGLPRTGSWDLLLACGEYSRKACRHIGCRFEMSHMVSLWSVPNMTKQPRTKPRHSLATLLLLHQKVTEPATTISTPLLPLVASHCGDVVPEKDVISRNRKRLSRGSS